jgi:hypothetical protein
VSWTISTLDAGGDVGSFAALAMDSRGEPAVAYLVADCGDLRLARPGLGVIVYRGVVAALSVGWKAIALPLDDDTDDPTPPFPIHSASPGTASDPVPASEPLVLHRVLVGGTADAGKVLRAAEETGVVALSF